MNSTVVQETTRNRIFSTTVEMTTASNYTGSGAGVDIGAADEGSGGGGVRRPAWQPSQWPTAAVLGGVVLLALIGVVVVLLYRKRRQRDYQRRTKRSEEEIGFMDAEAENRRSDIALQLLQVTDPSYFELEEAAQNAKLEELQGQNDLSILEIIQVAEPPENDTQGQAQTNATDSGPKTHTSTEKDSGEGTGTSKGSTPGTPAAENKMNSEQKDARKSNISVETKNSVARSSSKNADSQREIKDTMKRSSTANVDSQKEIKDTVKRSSTAKVDSQKEIKDTVKRSSTTNGESKNCKTGVNSTRLSSNIRISKTEEADNVNSATQNGIKRESKASNENRGNRSSLESRVEERIRQRQSARSSGGHSTDRRASEKLNHNQSLQHPVNGVALVTDGVRPSSSASSSKHSSVNYEETIKQLKHIDSDPNIAGQ